ncbi:hypothetical protein [Carboxylicivirga caseinilyticus]|uniref:hypothetical protein n=1 Tax=Carboxylicivirga caseinilyticus TaxID=3417572 RepID=UPI003D330210|nr:hypothetical protein [Marinilabiliaceae bacterium A049]
MNRIKILMLLFISTTFANYSNAQLLETRHQIGITAGYGTLSGISGSTNMFFPSEVNQTGFSFDFSYGHKIYSWLSGGAALGFYNFSEPSTRAGFAQILTDGGNLISVGPQLFVHSPHKEGGLMNRLRLGLSISPQMHLYSGSRSMLVDNEIIPFSETESLEPVYNMTDSSTGFSLKISPEANLRLSQRIGLKLSYNVQYFNIYTGYDNEGTYLNSLMGGLIITLGNYRHVFL